MLNSMASMLLTYSISNLARYLYKSVSKHTKVDFTTSDSLVNEFTEESLWQNGRSQFCLRLLRILKLLPARTS
jgi:hypothetical protein